METYSVDFSIPREPSAYRRTEHFRYRFHRRTDPEITGEVVRECIENGRVKPTAASDRRIFEAEVDGITWWVIVKFLNEAFVKDSEKHLALTAYAPDEHEKTKEEWKNYDG